MDSSRLSFFSPSYFSFHVCASVLAPSSRVLCLHRSPNEPRNASPSGRPTPRPTLVDLSDEGGGLAFAVGFEAIVVIVSGAIVDETVVVTRADAETVTVITSVLLGEVEPVVRLNITFPAVTRNGAVLPRVEMLHRLDVESISAQQKCKPSWTPKSDVPWLVLTEREVKRVSEFSLIQAMIPVEFSKTKRKRTGYSGKMKD